MFVINHLTKQYGTEFALQDVTMRLGKGMHFIVGASGSGKTPLLKILSGMEGDFEGEVSYNGKPMGDFSTKEKAACTIRSSALCGRTFIFWRRPRCFKMYCFLPGWEGEKKAPRVFCGR